MNRTEAKGRFVWIGSDAWTGYVAHTGSSDPAYNEELRSRNLKILSFMLIKNFNKFRIEFIFVDSVGFVPKSDRVVRFIEYFTKISLKDRSGPNAHLNPWFAQYFAKNLHCNVTGNKYYFYQIKNCFNNLI